MKSWSDLFCLHITEAHTHRIWQAGVRPAHARRGTRLLACSLAIGLLLLSGCQSLQEAGLGTGMAVPEAEAQIVTPMPVQRSGETQASATAPIAGPSLVETPMMEAPDKAATPTTGPLRFSFPTPGPAPVSAWRPPLYQVPWALTPHDHFYFARPIAADEVNWPLADYRYGGKFFEDIVHTGVDIPAPLGTPVLATGPGKVVSAGYGLYSGLNDPDDPYGLAVVIRHDFGYQGQTLYTVYGHLSQVDVAPGQHLETGEQLGLVGQTGFTTGPHLHFEVRLGENRIFTTRNPELWMAPPMGWGVLAGRVMETSGRLAYSQEVLVHNLDTGQTWTVVAYNSEVARSDAYYQENLVIGDLPAGLYELEIAYYGILYKQTLRVQAGAVNYFTFQGRRGFGPSTPPTPDLSFTPAPAP